MVSKKTIEYLDKKDTLRIHERFYNFLKGLIKRCE